MNSSCGLFFTPLIKSSYGACKTRWNVYADIRHLILLNFEYLYMEYVNLAVFPDRLESIRATYNCSNNDLLILDVADEVYAEIIANINCTNFKNAKGRSWESDWNSMSVIWSMPGYNADSAFMAKYKRKLLERSDANDIQKDCEKSWIKYDKFCYKMFLTEEPVTWVAARSLCNDASGRLVRISSPHEMDFIHQSIFSSWYIIDDYPGIYIGLTDGGKTNNKVIVSDGQGVYRWIDNRPVSFSSWFLGQPNGSYSEDCAMINLIKRTSQRNWHDVACNKPLAKRYICQKDTQTPELIAPTWPKTEEKENCSSKFFQCDNGECIHPDYICDGVNHCVNAEDEAKCEGSGSTCKWYEYECESKNCVPISAFCNHLPDCPDSSDESYCVWPLCNDDEFRCENGQCIKSDLIDNYVRDCVDGSDERVNSVCKGFLCYDGRCIPDQLSCDGFVDCSGAYGEDEMNCRKIAENGTTICKNGMSYNESSRCIFEKEYGLLKTCRDATHLETCENVPCQDGMFKCSKSYCIPSSYVCDNEMDCPDGTDEVSCESYICPGGLKCDIGSNCVEEDDLCDSKYDCMSKIDETLCWECPSQCECFGEALQCEDQMMQFSPELPGKTRFLSLRNNKLTTFIFNISFLGDLDLSNNLIESVSGEWFLGLPNLYSLNLSYNFLHKISTGTFTELKNLKHVHITGNPISSIEVGAFTDAVNSDGFLSRLRTLDLSNLLIHSVAEKAFYGLPNLRHLNLSSNKLRRFEEHSLIGLQSLDQLVIDNNQLELSKTKAFGNLYGLKKLRSDNFFFCCIMDWVRPENCWPSVDVFSSCTDLMRSDILRIFLWVLGVLASVGNLMALIIRIVIPSNPSANANIISSLCLSDLLMGLYLIILATADTMYRGDYILYDYTWRNSIWCSTAGVFSMMSSEVSLIMLALLSFDRYMAIVHPFSSSKLDVKSSLIAIIMSWVVIAILSLLPLLPLQYFDGRFFSETPVCLSIPLTSEKTAAWEYSTSIYLGLNTIILTMTVYFYFGMYQEIREISEKVKTDGKKGRESQVAKRMAVIIMTDLICWVPVLIIGALAVSGLVMIPGDMHSWIAVFVLPINSALNPYIYTLSDPRVVNKVLQKCMRKKNNNKSEKKTVTMTTRSSANMAADTIQSSIREYICDVDQGEYSSLGRILKESNIPVTCKLRLNIVKDVLHGLMSLNEDGFSHGFIDTNHIAIETSEKSAFLCLGYAISKDVPETRANDMNAIGMVVRRLLQIR